MKNPTTIEEIINWPKEYRIVNGCIGKCQEIDYRLGRVKLFFGTDGSEWFKLSDVQELTPLSYEGKRIAIGDWVKYSGKWFHVTGYFYTREWLLSVWKSDADTPIVVSTESIAGHKTTKHDPEAIARAIELLTDCGVIKDGKILV